MIKTQIVDKMTNTGPNSRDMPVTAMLAEARPEEPADMRQAYPGPCTAHKQRIERRKQVVQLGLVAAC